MFGKTLLCAAALLVAALAPAAAEEASAEAGKASPERIVMTWVPPYDRATSWKGVTAKYGKTGPSEALSHLGLQFWQPTRSGGLERVPGYGDIKNAEIKDYVRWAHKHDVKVMLTVYNGYPQWDWALAKSAFGDNKKAFVKALVAEMQALDLDGVDVDLEGPGLDPTPDDKSKYMAFIKSLAEAVHAKRKTVQIDSFHYVYNAPNQTWWPDLFKVVDQLASMGYEDLGRNAPGWQSYKAQSDAAGSAKNQSKLIIGVPTYLDSWQGDDAVVQMKWFAGAKARAGVGAWDARDAAEAWRSKPLWNWLEKVRKGED